jgi:hypothetical protein
MSIQDLELENQTVKRAKTIAAQEWLPAGPGKGRSGETYLGGTLIRDDWAQRTPSVFSAGC